MGHFPSTESDCHLDAVANLDKFGQLAQFHLVITFLGTRTKLDFLNVHLALFLALIVQLLFLLELEFAVIHQSTDWWFGIGYQLNEIQVGVYRQLLCLFQRYNALLFSVFTDQANFRRRYFFVKTALFVVCDLGLSNKPKLMFSAKINPV